MLIQLNIKPPTTIGNILLQPGVNNVDDTEWKMATESSGYSRSINSMIESEQIEVLGGKKKLTIEMVKNTYNVDILKEWELDPQYKGPLKGAIRSQIEAVELVEDAG